MQSDSPPPKYAIEDLLPKEFIYEIGIYLQTCAHIELLASALIVCLEGLHPRDKMGFQKYAKYRKLPTSKLLKALRKAAKNAEKLGFSKNLTQLCDWLDQFVSNRHIAVHGAFVAAPQGFLRVGYVHRRENMKGPKYENERTAVTQSLVHEAVEDADSIYRDLLGMIEKIEPGLSSTVLNSVIPIVTHPSSTH